MYLAQFISFLGRHFQTETKEMVAVNKDIAKWLNLQCIGTMEDLTHSLIKCLKTVPSYENFIYLESASFGKSYVDFQDVDGFVPNNQALPHYLGGSVTITDHTVLRPTNSVITRAIKTADDVIDILLCDTVRRTLRDIDGAGVYSYFGYDVVVDETSKILHYIRNEGGFSMEDQSHLHVYSCTGKPATLKNIIWLDEIFLRALIMTMDEQQDERNARQDEANEAKLYHLRSPM